MPSRGEPVIPFSPLKLLKADVRTDHNGVSMVLEFIDNNGVRLTTPSIPYPDNFDPMRIEHAECRGDQIRIKNENGDTLLDVYADSIDYDNPIGTSLNSHGNLCIEPDSSEENLPLRTFSVEHAHASQVGWDRAMSEAFSEANFARQHLDNAVQDELNVRYHEEHPEMGASAWFREVSGRSSLRTARDTQGYPYVPPMEQEVEEPRLKIDFDMKCSCCDGKIHYPDKLIDLLGTTGTVKYFEFCEKTKTEPQLFCCSCFGLMKNNSNIISAVNKMNQKVKKMADLTEKEEELAKREKELDEQLKKVKK